MSSEIMARLSLDESRFETGIDKAERRFESFGQKVRSMNFDRGAQNFNRAFGVGGSGSGGGAGGSEGSGGGAHGHDFSQSLNRDFGIGPAVRTLLLFGATNSAVEKVVEKIAGLWKEAAESAKKIAEFSEKSYAATLKTIGLRQTDEQKLGVLRRDASKDRKELDQINMFSAGGVATDKDKERAAELAAKLNENGTDQQELIDKIAEKKRKDWAETKKRMNEEMAAQIKNNYDRMSLEEKIAEQKRRQGAYDERSRMSSNPAERSALEVKFQESVSEQIKLQADLDQKKLDTDKKINEELEKFFNGVEQGGKRAEAHRQQEIKARLALGQAETNLSEARADRTHITLGDAVAGKRGTPTERAQARRIQQLEDRARRVRDAGGDLKDENGHPVSADSRAQQLMDRAGDLRKNMGGLDRNDREPFRALEDQMKAAVTALDEISGKLDPENLD